MKFGDSDKLRLGEWVIAIGNPFSLGGTVTAGIVSARNRDINSGPYDNYIQTDAVDQPRQFRRSAVQPGRRSDRREHRDHLAVGRLDRHRLRGAVEDGDAGDRPAPQFGETRRGWLGVQIQQVTDEIAESLNLKPARGALIAGVDDKGPAKPAGIEAGDVIVKFDGKDIKEMRDLPRIVADTPVGKDVEVIDHPQGQGRDEDRQARPPRGRREAGAGVRQVGADAERSRSCRSTLGLQLSDMTDALRKKYKIKDSVKGVVITEVDAASVAADKRLTAGSVIVAIEQEQITNAADVQQRSRR